MNKIDKLINRDSQLLELCRDKSVLHLGCVGFTDCSLDQKVALAKNSLHARLSKECECVGVDYDDKTINELKSAGVFDNVIYGNVEELSKIDDGGKQYDVVLAGDIIEHLSNPGLMLQGIKPLLKEDGVLVVSTPNSFGAAAFVRYFLGRFREGEEHVICFNHITLEQLLERYQYSVSNAYTCYQDVAKKQYGVAFKLFKKLLEIVPRFGGTLLFVCHPKK
jgi:SAM-dependent methyltransferase